MEMSGLLWILSAVAVLLASGACAPEPRDCMSDDFVCVPGVGCVALEQEERMSPACLAQCGARRLYDRCLYPTLRCLFDGGGEARLVESHKCFLQPDCIRGLCIRGQARQCSGGVPCDPARGCPAN